MKKSHNYFLDIIRGIACIVIILYHYTSRYQELFPLQFDWLFTIEWGWMAVSVFYVLSGYLSLYSLKEENGNSYITKKIVRLYPAYWAAVIITFFVTKVFLPSRSVSFGSFLFNFTMLESFVGIDLVDGAYWTLANELIFYMFFYIVVFVFKKRDKIQWFCLAWILILIVFHYIEKEESLYLAIGKLIARPYGHMFIIGLCIADLFTHSDNCIKKHKILSVVNIIICMIYQSIVFESAYFVFIFIVVCILILADIIHWFNPTMSKKYFILFRPVIYVAEISYPLYLVHQNVGYAIINAFVNAGLQNEIIIIVPIGVSIVLAILIHRYIEIPSLKWQRNAIMIIK